MLFKLSPKGHTVSYNAFQRISGTSLKYMSVPNAKDRILTGVRDPKINTTNQ